MDILVLCHYGLYQDLSCSFVHAQAKAFAALGHRVRVVIPIAYGKSGPGGTRFFPRMETAQRDGVELYYVRYASLSGYGEGGWNAKRALAAVRRKRNKILDAFSPAVLHAHTLGFDSQVGAEFKKILGCPLVVTSHGSDASIPYEKGERDKLRRWCDSADGVVAVSSALAKKLRSCGSDTPIHVIVNGFKTEHLPAPQKKNALSFIQVGHLTEQKRVHITIRAFSELHQYYPEARLTIVGDGGRRPMLDALCQELGVGEFVRFTGHIPNEQVLAELARSQFFVMPSVREGFGIVYLEAMACGCVTVGTKGEGIADVIIDGENGFLVDPDDPQAIVSAVHRCLEEPQWARQIAQKGRQDALLLTWEANAEQYCRLFEQMQ